MACSRSMCAVLSLLVACALLTPAEALAQGEEINLRDLARRGRTIQGWVKAPITGANKDVFNQFFDRYYFPQMMKTDLASLGELADNRTKLFERYIWPAHPSVQKELTEKTFAFASRQFNSKSPAPQRYNAVLMLGSLDEKYATKNDPTATPHAGANDLLCRMVRFRDRMPTYIEVAALIGLQRHTKHFASLGDKEKKATAIVLLEAVDQQKFRPGASRDVQNWIKLQAANGIANMGVAGSGGAFVKAIAKMVADPSVDLGARSSAAVLLKKIKLDGLPAPVANGVVGAVKNLACAVGEQEMQYAEGFLEKQRQRGRMASGLDKSPRYYLDETGWKYERDGLAAQLEQLRLGLDAVKPIAGQDAAAVEAIARAVGGAISTANDDSNIDFNVTDSVRDMAKQIASVAGCKPAAEPEEEAADLLGAR